jgi:hypothetical protein
VGAAPVDDWAKVRPAGSAPEVTDQAYGGAPPLAAKFWLV